MRKKQFWFKGRNGPTPAGPQAKKPRRLAFHLSLCLTIPLTSDSPPSAKPSILSDFSVYLFGFSAVRLVYPTLDCLTGKIECLLFQFDYFLMDVIFICLH